MVLDKPVVDNAGTSLFSLTGSANAHLAEATAVRNKRAEVRPFDQDILECLIFVWGDPRSQALSERGKLDKFRSLAEQSLAHQQQTERDDVVDFESFLKSYLAFE